MIEDLTGKQAGAIELTAVGDEYDRPCRIVGILWVGATTSGDVVLIKGRGLTQNKTLWPGRTDVSNTYLGAIWGPPGIHAPHGFRAAMLDAGTVFVYLAE